MENENWWSNLDELKINRQQGQMKTSEKEMKSLTIKTLTIVALATSSSLFVGNTANAEGIFDNFKLSYASQETNENRSKLFDRFDDGADEHELNDAWLGMPVKSNEGKLVGTVAYAYLDDAGDVSELLVELSSSQLTYAVYIDGKNANLSDIDVSIALTTKQIAALEREEGNQFAMR